MSFQDVHSDTCSNRNHPVESSDTVPFLRMRRNHPPKLPRVHAIPFTPPASSKRPGNGSKTREKSAERNMGNSCRSKKVLDDDLIDSYELKLSNSNSSYSETSVLDPYIESRDDYESFGPDRSEPKQRYSDTSKSSSQRQYRKLTRHQQNQNITNRNKASTSVSTFAKLTYEMQQYQKLVSDLEYMIRDTIVTPEGAWRTNILVKSVEETDAGIEEQLVQYEHSLAQQERLLTYNSNQRTNHNETKRMTQQLAACAKVRRDFNRCHNSMIFCLQTHEMRQKAEVSQLGAVQWNATHRSTSSVHQHASPQMEEDFFERTMRQKELERMNDSMRKVNDIYHGLAGLVNGQQELIDQLDDKVHDSQANVKSGYNEYSCFVARQNGWNTLCGDMNEWGQSEDDYNDSTGNYNRNSTMTTTTQSRDPSSTATSSVEHLRIHENFYWSMPLETMAEDLKSVQNDLREVGKKFIHHCQRLDCCNDE